jgi:heme/copper-type cytochrome/quinol oxidase subunit 2
MPVNLVDLCFWAAALCCAIAQVAILRSVIISPTRAAGARPAEVVWAVVPGIALVFVFIATWRAIHPAMP